MIGEALTEMAYGTHEFEEMDVVNFGEELTKVLNVTLNGYLVELFPFREHHLHRVLFFAKVKSASVKRIPAWFPGAKFKRDAEVWRQQFLRGRDYPFNAVKARRVRLSSRLKHDLTESNS